MNSDRLTYLLNRYLSDSATAAEREELSQYVQNGDREEQFTNWIAEEIANWKEPITAEQADRYTGMARKAHQVDIVPGLPEDPVAGRQKVIRPWIWAAASVAVILTAVAFWYSGLSRKTPPPVAVAQTQPIAPGSNGAILTLANGKQIVLDSMDNGVIASQSGAKVVLKNGRLLYDITGHASADIAYNTISTPKGRQFQVTLPDGTKVWLNSVSSLRYPTIFTGDERRVELNGEAYFEVAKDAAMLFHINVGNRAEVEVLGTHFNVNAYENEQTLSTTLLEGKVLIKKQQEQLALLPGQQAQIWNDRAMKIVLRTKVDIDKIMAWKNGLFNFEGQTLQDIMRQLERWYDIDVVYEKGVPDIELTGEISKGVTLNGLLTGLAELGLRYRLEGRKLVVLP